MNGLHDGVVTRLGWVGAVVTGSPCYCAVTLMAGHGWLAGGRSRVVACTFRMGGGYVVHGSGLLQGSSFLRVFNEFLSSFYRVLYRVFIGFLSGFYRVVEWGDAGTQENEDTNRGVPMKACPSYYSGPRLQSLLHAYPCLGCRVRLDAL